MIYNFDTEQSSFTDQQVLEALRKFKQNITYSFSTEQSSFTEEQAMESLEKFNRTGLVPPDNMKPALRNLSAKVSQSSWYGHLMDRLNAVQ